MSKNIRENWFEKMKKAMAKHVSEEGECHIWQEQVIQKRTPGLRYGVINVKFPHYGKRTKIHLHRLSYLISQRIFHMPMEENISHLCHNSMCVNLHLSKEPILINNLRKTCVANNHCFGHYPSPNCLLHLKF